MAPRTADAAPGPWPAAVPARPRGPRSVLGGQEFQLRPLAAARGQSGRRLRTGAVARRPRSRRRREATARHTGCPGRASAAGRGPRWAAGSPSVTVAHHTRMTNSSPSGQRTGQGALQGVADPDADTELLAAAPGAAPPAGPRPGRPCRRGTPTRRRVPAGSVRRAARSSRGCVRSSTIAAPTTSRRGSVFVAFECLMCMCLTLVNICGCPVAATGLLARVCDQP